VEHHRVIFTLGHDEYWTMTQRDAIQSARDHGVSLAFIGADAGYWQARLEPDARGVVDRTLVCYKIETDLPNDPTTKPENDPQYAINKSLTTAQFRDPIVNRPENELMGLMYSSIVERDNGGRNYGTPDWVVRLGPPDSMLVGTGLVPGEHISHGLLGYEYDRTFENGKTPTDLVVLGASPLISYQGVHDIAITAYYRAPSGALVFDAGTLWWGWGLDDFVPIGAAQPNVLHGNQQIANLTLNILRAMLIASPPPSPIATPTVTITPTPSPTSTTVASPTPKH